MAEKKEDNEPDQQEVVVQTVITRRPIDEPIKIFYRRLKKGTKRFIEYQVPSAKEDYKSWIKSYRGGIGMVGLLLVTLIPLFLNDTVYYHTFIMAMIYAIFAASWDLLCGISGQISFGHAAFFGIGGYGCAYFIIYLGLDWFSSIFIGSIMAILFGLLVAVPCLRFKGPYLALGTLAFSLLLFNLFHMASLSHIFFGEYGIPISTLSVFSFKGNIITEFFIVLIFMVICVTVILAISNSRLGTIFKAIRDDETATEAAGINTTRYKLLAFMISAFFAGVAGSFYVLHIGKADYNIYASSMSFYPIIFTLIGGIALISGSVFGAYFFAITNLVLDELFDFFAQINFFPEFFENLPSAFVALIFSIILLILIRFTKRGIMEPTIKHSKTLYDLIVGK